MKTQRTTFTFLLTIFFCVVVKGGDRINPFNQNHVSPPFWKSLVLGYFGQAKVNTTILQGITAVGSDITVPGSPAVNFLSFAGGMVQNKQVPLRWAVIASKEIERFEIERSTDNSTYGNIGIVTGTVKLNEEEEFDYTDDISDVNTDILYYRLKVISKTGEIKYSNVRIVRLTQRTAAAVTVIPNPATNDIAVTFIAQKKSRITVKILDALGKTILKQKHRVTKGSNVIGLHNLAKYGTGLYSVWVFTHNEIITQKLIINN